MRHIQSYRRFTYGFTIIELIVSISIVSLMLFLVNRIFNDTNRAVSRGIELSEVISQERALQTHLQNDVAAMFGPAGSLGGTTGDGGPLVIINHQINGLRFDLPDSPITDPNLDGDNDAATRSVRLDQLMFIRDGASSQDFPISPSSVSGFTPYPPTKKLPARVWYGHLMRTNNVDGSNLDNTLTQDLHQTGDFLDSRPTSWLMGRQALFLADSGEALNNFIVQANGVEVNAPVGGYGGSGPAWGAAPLALYMGLTDLADASHLSGVQTGNGCVIADIEAVANNSTTVLAGDTTLTNYQLRAAQHHTYAQIRLRGNDRPLTETYAAWEIAQMHPTIAEGISDFIVEFAADADVDGEVDRVDTIESNALFGDESFTGTIKWYTHDGYVNRPGPTDVATAPVKAAGVNPVYDPTSPLTFELPAGVVRDSVYVDDLDALPGAPATGFPAGTAAFVWRHDRYDADFAAPGLPPGNAYCDWPYLLRVRYRMHDPSGDLASGDGQHGVWFEQILKVNRPFVP